VDRSSILSTVVVESEFRYEGLKVAIFRFVQVRISGLGTDRI
jgi:hypothetical protein